MATSEHTARVTFWKPFALTWARRSGEVVDWSAVLAFVLFELAFAVAYGLGLPFTRSRVTPFWFPDAVLLCALLVSPPSRWIWFVVGAAPIRLFFFLPATPQLWFLLACWANDSLKALLSAWLLRGISRPVKWTADPAAFTRFVLVAVGLSPALSALLGAASRAAMGADFGRAWRTWFLGNALASLVLTPLLVTLVTDHKWLARSSPARLAGAAVLAVGLAGTGYLAFHGGLSGQGYPPFLLYLPVPFLLAAGVVFGLTGSSAALFLLSLLAIYGTLGGRGPFYRESVAESMLSIQLFLVVVSLPFMFLSVLIEQQRKTDRSLRESERRFGSLVDAAPVMVWMASIDGLYTFFNRPWLEFTGRTTRESLGRGREASIHPEDRQRCAADYDEAFEARRKFTSEYRLRRADGAFRWVLESGIPRYGPDETFLGYVGSCVDITERKESEDRLRHMSAQLMRAQESERSRIGQELHDDLSQRAAALTLSLSYLARRRTRDVAREVEELQQQAADLCNGIRHVSHQLRPAILERLGLAAALRDLCHRASTEGQRVTVSNAPALPALPDEVAIALYRIAQEAVQNAVRHSGAALIEIELSACDDAVAVSVSDSGRGFAVGSVPLPGLGLSGMAERMRNAGGSLSIHSAAGAGTTVTARVPLADQARLAV